MQDKAKADRAAAAKALGELAPPRKGEERRRGWKPRKASLSGLDVAAFRSKVPRPTRCHIARPSKEAPPPEKSGGMKRRQLQARARRSAQRERPRSLERSNDDAKAGKHTGSSETRRPRRSKNAAAAARGQGRAHEGVADAAAAAAKSAPPRPSPRWRPRRRGGHGASFEAHTRALTDAAHRAAAAIKLLLENAPPCFGSDLKQQVELYEEQGGGDRGHGRRAAAHRQHR